MCHLRGRAMLKTDWTVLTVGAHQVVGVITIFISILFTFYYLF